MADGRLSRRSVLAGMAGALGCVACDDRSARAQAGGAGRTAGQAARPARALSALGVDRFANRDQHRALQRAFDAARDGGFDLLGDPEANYRHDGALRLDGVSLDGRGCTLSSLSTGPRALRPAGSGWRVANLRLVGGARERTSDPDRNGVTVGGDRPAGDFVLENVVVEGAGPGLGVSGAGFFFGRAGGGRIGRITARGTLADGIHTTDGSHDLLFSDTLSESTGDDGFAIVSYVQQGRVCRNIRLTGGVSRGSLGRGFSVVGGRDVVLERPRAERSAAAGLYLYGEGGWNTFGVQRCRVVGAVMEECTTGRGQPQGFSQGAILIGGRHGEDVMDGERLPRGASGCVLVNPAVSGAGAACTGAIVLHEFALAPRIVGARLRDIASGGSPQTPNGIEIGGRDVVVEDARITDVAGLAFGVTRTASGTCLISGAQVSGSRLAGTGADSFVYVDRAEALRRVEVRNGTFARGPRRIAAEGLPGRLHLSNNLLR